LREVNLNEEKEVKERNSYKINEVASNVQKEIKRLKGQVDLFWEKEIKCYEEYGLCDGMEVVEFGSGPGFLSEKLMERYPNIKLTMIEIDPFLVDYSDEYLRDKFPGRFSVKVGSVLDSKLPDNHYDFSISRLLIEHLPNPEQAGLEIKRVLKVGGKAFFIDNDFEMHIMTYPPIKELRVLYDAYCEARENEGGNPRIGRQLPQILRKSGYKNICFKAICVHNEIIGDEAFFNSEGIGIASKMMKDGYLTSAEMAKISVAWRNVIRNKEHSIVRQLFAAAGEKLDNM
jgi:ubiquinone/menaquinone biosynthesis C-methylase UbiE